MFQLGNIVVFIKILQAILKSICVGFRFISNNEEAIETSLLFRYFCKLTGSFYNLSNVDVWVNWYLEYARYRWMVANIGGRLA